MKFKESVGAATTAHRYSPPPIFINSNQNNDKHRVVIKNVESSIRSTFNTFNNILIVFKLQN